MILHSLLAGSRSLLKRASDNPIIKPRPNNPWESQNVFNTAALYLDGKVHFIYRAMGHSGVSVLGYAASQDGICIDERSLEPAYVCSGPIEQRKGYAHSSGGSFSSAEDPRLTKIDDMIYMTYTAFCGWENPLGVALTSISVNDFLRKRWKWREPVLISSPDEIHKNWVIFPEKIHGEFAILHSISPTILIDYCDTLDFQGSRFIQSYYRASGRERHWDNWVRGVGPLPIKTKDGWLVLYHAMDKNDPNKYKIGALILDEHNPKEILYRCSTPLLEPDAHYENNGFKTGVIYSCGAIVKDEKLYVYYGAADTSICVAIADLNLLLEEIKQ